MSDVDEPIRLAEYDPDWPVFFEAEAERLSSHLAPDLAIEHIGSTAIPGLAAKPIVDIMMGTEAHHDLAAVRSGLVSLGYEDMGEAGVPGRVYLRNRTGPDFNIALVDRDGPLWASNIALRDYLRRNPEARNEYALMKMKAVESGITSLLEYSDFKKALLSDLLRRACGPEQA